jgi:hypothetical protein
MIIRNQQCFKRVYVCLQPAESPKAFGKTPSASLVLVWESKLHTERWVNKSCGTLRLVDLI